MAKEGEEKRKKKKKKIAQDVIITRTLNARGYCRNNYDCKWKHEERGNPDNLTVVRGAQLTRRPPDQTTTLRPPQIGDSYGYFYNY